MLDNSQSNAEHLGDQLPTGGRQVKLHRRRNGVSSAKPAASTAAQVTIQCPREVLAIFDAASSRSGVNRQQLFREALELYAAGLQRGIRSWRDPTLRE